MLETYTLLKKVHFSVPQRFIRPYETFGIFHRKLDHPSFLKIIERKRKFSFLFFILYSMMFLLLTDDITLKVQPCYTIDKLKAIFQLKKVSVTIFSLYSIRMNASLPHFVYLFILN